MIKFFAGKPSKKKLDLQSAGLSPYLTYTDYVPVVK